MPWQECSIMSQRLEFVLLARQEDVNHSALCRRFGISRKTGYKWLARYETAGDSGLADQSRRPHHHPAQTPPDLEAAILAVRTAHPAWGGRKIKAWLERRGIAAPSPSTITAILERNGRLAEEHERPQRTWQRFEAAASNDLWQLDFKGGVRLGNGEAFPLTVLDDHSRFALGLFACSDQKQTTVQAHLTGLFQRYGLPRRILTDNGPPWGPSRTYGITAFEAWLIRLGIRVRPRGHPSRIYHPQTQGKVERFHGSLAAEVLRGPQFVDCSSCQHAFDRWRDCYNLERPHEALDLAVPVERYRPSPRLLPPELPSIVYGPDDAVRMVKAHGVIAYRGRRYFVSRGLAGLPVAVRRTRDPARVQVYFCQQLVKELTLHPSSVDR